MSDLISRQEAIDFFKNCYTGLSMSADEAYYKILYTLRTLPSVEPERTAKVTDNVIHVICCEKCKRVISIIDNYCPGCGAKLDWSENDGRV